MNVPGLVIRNGTIVDGEGGEPRIADVAVRGDRIVAVASGLPPGDIEIDATGLIVTPGFVDIHTHYDGQATWGASLAPSSAHGVTTVVMGNCGIGFAPCRPEHRQPLIELMEGVEDIPDAVMSVGLPWDWETFPDYLDALERRPHDVDIAAQLPHASLRVYVMGARGLSRELATPADLTEMARLTREAVRAGALGVTTSRTLNHRTPDGEFIPSYDADEAELHALAAALAAEGKGVFQAVLDFDERSADENFDLLRRIARRSGRPLTFSLTQPLNQPAVWKRMLERLSGADDEGLQIRAQVFPRPTGMLLGLDLSYNPFSFHPSYQEIAHLPLEERVAEMRRDQRREAILGESAIDSGQPFLVHLDRFEWMFDLGDPPNYEPLLSHSFAAIAAARGSTPERVAYDFLLERNGLSIILLPRANYSEGTLDPVLTMMRHKSTVLGLGDGGAHCGVICDASSSTSLLSYWARDRKGEGLSLAQAVRALTVEPAEAVGLFDRARILPGYKADLNVIDHTGLTLYAPTMVQDLPDNGRRLHQPAKGYVATIVNGVVTRQNDASTGKLPGRLVRGSQAAPVGQRAWARI